MSRKKRTKQLAPDVRRRLDLRRSGGSGRHTTNRIHKRKNTRQASKRADIALADA